jgi:hypothetical protein
MGRSQLGATPTEMVEPSTEADGITHIANPGYKPGWGSLLMSCY